jgi:hypothetical protein
VAVAVAVTLLIQLKMVGLEAVEVLVRQVVLERRVKVTMAALPHLLSTPIIGVLEVVEQVVLDEMQVRAKQVEMDYLLRLSE